MTFVAPVVGEVDVDVRHRDAGGIEEALEDQVVLERIERGDAEGVGDDAAGGRASARPNQNVLLAGETDKVPDHEEVVGEPHRLDDAELIFEPVADLSNVMSVEVLHSIPAQVLQVAIGGEAVGDIEVRKVIASETKVNVTHLGDANRVR